MSISKGIPNETKEKMIMVKNGKEEQRESLQNSIREIARKLANNENISSSWVNADIAKLLDLNSDLRAVESQMEMLQMYSKPNEEEGKSDN
ncbi:hypothetical protein CN918_31405 [Priestia megaterium]|nr:hypothetical protein CN918_31405 [Priestia megaterium]